jgi:hypothetical protein
MGIPLAEMTIFSSWVSSIPTMPPLPTPLQPQALLTNKQWLPVSMPASCVVFTQSGLM